MGTYLAQAGTTLNRVTRAGVATALTLPTGITLYGTSRPSRAAILGNYIVVVNGGLHDIVIDAQDVCRPLRLEPPSTPPVIAEGTATGGVWADGVYKGRVTFLVKDEYGRVIMESAPSPVATSAAFTTATSLEASSVPISTQSVVNARRIYLTVNGGTVFYQWLDIDDNTRTAIEEAHPDTTDLALEFNPQVVVGTPPDFSLIAHWRERLFGIPRDQPDYVRWSEERQFYNWPTVNESVVGTKDVDTYGCTGFVPRRDALGIGRRNGFWRRTGFTNDTMDTQQISDIGLVSQESVVVVGDVGYYLGVRNGRYVFAEWDDRGVVPISEAKVDAWFNPQRGGSNAYFSATYYPVVRGRYNARLDAVQWLLAASGASTLERWVSFHLRSRTWFGPHKTAGFTTTCAATDNNMAGTLTATDDSTLAIFGSSDGYLYKEDPTTANDQGSAVDFDCDTPFFHGDAPDVEKVWMQPTIHTGVEAAGTLTITPKVGSLAASAGSAISHTLTLGRERLRRLGLGRYAQLNLRHNTVDQGARILGLELPFHRKGRR